MNGITRFVLERAIFKYLKREFSQEIVGGWKTFPEEPGVYKVPKSLVTKISDVEISRVKLT